MDQESSLFLPESEPGPNYEIQRLSITTTQNTTSGQVDWTSSVLVVIRETEVPVRDPVCRTDPSLHSLSAGMEQVPELIEIDPPVSMTQTPPYSWWSEQVILGTSGEPWRPSKPSERIYRLIWMFLWIACYLFDTIWCCLSAVSVFDQNHALF